MIFSTNLVIFFFHFIFSTQPKLLNVISLYDIISPQRDEEEEAADTLKWIEENIPESENPLPVIDSEEEIETTKFEISKMQ